MKRSPREKKIAPSRQNTRSQSSVTMSGRSLKTRSKAPQQTPPKKVDPSAIPQLIGMLEKITLPEESPQKAGKEKEEKTDSQQEMTEKEELKGNGARLIVYFDLNDTMQTTRSSDFGRYRPRLGEMLAALEAAHVDVRIYIKDGTLDHHMVINDHLGGSGVQLPFHATLHDAEFNALDEKARASYKKCEEYFTATSTTKNYWMHKSCVYRMNYTDSLHEKLPLSEEEQERTVIVDDDVFDKSRFHFGRIVPALKRNPEAPEHVRPKDNFAAFSQDWECGLMTRILPALLRMQRDLQCALPQELLSLQPAFHRDAAIDYVKHWLSLLKGKDDRDRGISVEPCQEIEAILSKESALPLSMERSWRWTVWAFTGCASVEEIIFPLLSNRQGLYRASAVFANPYHFRR